MAAQRSKVAVINFNSSGDNTVISAPASGGITVTGIALTVSAATNLTFKNGTTAQSGAIQLTGAGSAMTLQGWDRGYYFADAGNNFVINSSQSVTVSGSVWYTSGA